MISKMVFTLSSICVSLDLIWFCSRFKSRISSSKFSKVTLAPWAWFCCCFAATNSFAAFTVFSLKVTLILGLESPSFPPLAWYTCKKTQVTFEDILPQNWALSAYLLSQRLISRCHGAFWFLTYSIAYWSSKEAIWEHLEKKYICTKLLLVDFLIRVSSESAGHVRNLTEEKEFVATMIGVLALRVRLFTIICQPSNHPKSLCHNKSAKKRNKFLVVFVRAAAAHAKNLNL